MRRFLDDVTAQIGALLPDNSTGLITPQAVRSVLTDILDSSHSGFAWMQLTAPASLEVPGESEVLVDVWDAYLEVDPAEVTTDPSTASFTTGYPGFQHRLSAEIRLAAAATALTWEIRVDGVAVASCGTNDLFFLLGYAAWPAPGSLIQLFVVNPGASAKTVNFRSAVFTCELVPTRYADAP